MKLTVEDPIFSGQLESTTQSTPVVLSFSATEKRGQDEKLKEVTSQFTCQFTCQFTRSTFAYNRGSFGMF